MNLLFFTKMDFGIKGNSGIQKKVFAQVKAFRALGFKVDLLQINSGEIRIEGDLHQVIIRPRNKLDYLYQLFFGHKRKVDYSLYQGIYIRHFLMNPLFLRYLHTNNKERLKVFMEIPTFPYRFEFKNASFIKKLGLLIDQYTVGFLKGRVNKIVTFSAEKKIFGIETILSDNAIDPDSFPVLPQPNYDGKTLHLLGVANVQPWHGYDRIIMGLKNYLFTKPKTNIVFHVVGEGSEVSHLKKLAKEIKENVIFHGFISGEKLKEIFATCHIGVGSFGMHRIGVANGQTSTLKAREYAARGLPMILGHRDRGFPKGYPFVKEFEAVESPIQMHEVVSFFNAVWAITNYPTQLGDFARENLTWKRTLEPVAKAFRA